MEENQYNPQRKKKLLESNWILSLTALFVSVSTLFILVYQTHLSNKMYYLEEKALQTSVLPILEISTRSNQGSTFQLDISNSGIGPARIESIYILYGDSVYAMDFPNLIWDYINPNLEEGKARWDFGYGNIGAGKIIPAQGSYVHIKANNPETASRMYDLFFNNESKVDLAITYTSVYEDETWTAYLKAPFEIPPKSEVVRPSWESDDVGQLLE